MSPLATHLATFGYALAGGIVPVFNVEAYLLALVALAPQTAVAPTVVCAAAGQMVAKGLLYGGGRGFVHRARGGREKVARVIERLAGAPGRANGVLLLSAITGLPSFYAVSVGAGLMKFPLRRFLAVGLFGRLLRFAVIVLLARLV